MKQVVELFSPPTRGISDGQAGTTVMVLRTSLSFEDAIPIIREALA
jgi:hypothetical protein